MSVKLCLTRAGLSVALLLFASTALAATVTSFVAVRTGDALTLSNPQAIPVSGQIRLIPDAGFAAPSPVPFSLPAQGSQTFSNVLSGFGPVNSPAILAVESSDVVSISSAPLRLGYPDRPLTLPVIFDPHTPATGSLILGILSGLIRVNIYEHATSVSPLVSRTFSAAGERVTRLRYVDLLPVGIAISDGYATVTPLSGQVVGTAVNPPTRRRAVGRGAAPPPVLSITGGSACEFATGVRASVPAVAGATYRWAVQNATAQGSLTSNTLDLALGSQGYASLTLTLTTSVNGSTTTAEASIRIDGRPVYTSSSATSVTLGQDATINWALGGSAPTSQTLSSTDFSAVNLAVSDTSYTYRPTTAGSKSFTLSATNTCGTGSASGTYVVSAACTAPHIDSFTHGAAVCAGGSVQLTWATSGSGTVTIDHGVGTVADSGSLAVSPSATTIYTITKSSSCGSDVATTTVTISPKPTATVSGTASICAGSSTTITAALTGVNPFTVNWSDGFNQTINSGTTASRSVSPASTTTYTVTNVSDANACSQAGTGSAVVTVKPLPTAAVSGSATICNGNSTTITAALTGTAPFTVTWSDGNVQTINSGTTASRSVSPNTTTTYTVTNVTDAGGCSQAGTGSAVVTVQFPPTKSVFTISSNPVSFGGGATISFTIANTTSWTITSSLGNTLTPGTGSGSGSFTVGYSADTATGADTVTLTQVGPCGTTISTIPVQVN